LPEDQEPVAAGPITDQQPESLDEEGIVRILDALPTRPLLAGQEGLRLSLAGAHLIVGNADAHGKNFSILYDDQGPRMAPLYALLPTVTYPDLSPKMAMRIGKRATLADMGAEAWQMFGKDAGIGFVFVRRRISEICDAIINASSNVPNELIISTGGETVIELQGVVCERDAITSIGASS
jgi:hypothetical protein